MPAPKLCPCGYPVKKGGRYCSYCEGEVLKAIRKEHPDDPPVRTLSRDGTEAAGRRIPRSFQAIAGTPDEWPE